jgi:hypothetical protein
MSTADLLFFILAVGLGAGLGISAYYFATGRHRKPAQVLRESTVLLERIEKVFKVVMAEGYFTEIYNYQDDKRFWSIFKDKKKALIIAKAKVLVGYDFGKMRIQIPEGSRKLVIEYFPSPEVLSMDTEYKFYDIEQGWINRFQSDDYTNLLNEAKQAMHEKALESDLPRIATNQVQLMIYQLAASMNWSIELALSKENQQQLDSLSRYKQLNPEVKPLPLRSGKEQAD